MILENTLGQKINNPENFWKWFDNSITVDGNGKPLVFYHGTRSDFTEFKTNYADNLVFFSYKKDFADRWGKEKRDYSNEISNDIFDKQDEFKRKLYKEYQAKYGEDFYDNDEYRKELNKELDDNLAKLEKERNVHSRTLGCYLKVNKIFYPEKDYELVLDEICKYYEWQNPNTKEYEEKLKRFEDEYDKANEYWNQWWANNKDADEKTIQAEEKKLDDAFKRYSVCKSIKTEFENNLNRIKKGAWVYFEHGNVVDKIWSLGYDAIQLSERDGEQTTLAVRAGNNQIKSVDNNGTWSKSTENIYEHLNERLRIYLENADILENPSILNIANENFWKWFNGSKCVENDGSPKIVYHGSEAHFKSFNKSLLGSATKRSLTDWHGEETECPSAYLGFFFTDDEDFAREYGDVLYKCYLKITNPLMIDMSEYMNNDEVLTKFIQQALKEKRDGVIFKNIREIGRPVANEYVVFEPNQIKEISNHGQWSDSNNIYERLNEELNSYIEVK